MTQTQKTFEDIEKAFTPEIVLAEMAAFGWKYNTFDEDPKMRCRLPILLDDEKGKREYSSNCLNSKTKKPLTEGEADIIFYTEAMTMKSILNDMLLRKKSSIEEINMNPDAMIYSERQRESDHKYERLSRLIEEERPRLSEEAEELKGSIIQLEQLIAYIKRSSANSIPRNSSIETNFSDSDSFDTAPEFIDI